MDSEEWSESSWLQNHIDIDVEHKLICGRGAKVAGEVTIEPRQEVLGDDWRCKICSFDSTSSGHKTFREFLYLGTGFLEVPFR